jgi:hypothetical protein
MWMMNDIPVLPTSSCNTVEVVNIVFAFNLQVLEYCYTYQVL